MGIVYWESGGVSFAVFSDVPCASYVRCSITFPFRCGDNTLGEESGPRSGALAESWGSGASTQQPFFLNAQIFYPWLSRPRKNVHAPQAPRNMKMRT